MISILLNWLKKGDKNIWNGNFGCEWLIYHLHVFFTLIRDWSRLILVWNWVRGLWNGWLTLQWLANVEWRLKYLSWLEFYRGERIRSAPDMYFKNPTGLPASFFGDTKTDSIYTKDSHRNEQSKKSVHYIISMAKNLILWIKNPSPFSYSLLFLLLLSCYTISWHATFIYP